MAAGTFRILDMDLLFLHVSMEVYTCVLCNMETDEYLPNEKGGYIYSEPPLTRAAATIVCLIEIPRVWCGVRNLRHDKGGASNLDSRMLP